MKEDRCCVFNYSISLLYSKLNKLLLIFSIHELNELAIYKCNAITEQEKRRKLQVDLFKQVMTHEKLNTKIIQSKIISRKCLFL